MENHLMLFFNLIQIDPGWLWAARCFSERLTWKLVTKLGLQLVTLLFIFVRQLRDMNSIYSFLKELRSDSNWQQAAKWCFLLKILQYLSENFYDSLFLHSQVSEQTVIWRCKLFYHHLLLLNFWFLRNISRQRRA